VAALLECLANAGDTAVAENAKKAGYELVLFPIPGDVLLVQETQQGLGNSQSNRVHQQFLP
jgi:hypothetical protein